MTVYIYMSSTVVLKYCLFQKTEMHIAHHTTVVTYVTIYVYMQS